MGQIIVRDLDDNVIEMIKAQAKANGRSFGAEVREILSRAVPAEGAGRSNWLQSDINDFVRGLRKEWEK